MTRGFVGWVILCAFTLAACLSPDVKHCPDVDCPANEVCDNHGGCALPEQLSQCDGAADGALCSYTDPAQNMVIGTCFGGECLPAGCGNGRVDNGEVCDDGNNVSGDGCSADCQSNEMCGNAIVDSAKGEQCDLGPANKDGTACEHDCSLPKCGNGIVDPTLNEECDAGALNADTPDAPCRTYCQKPRCGDGIVDPSLGEICDDGNTKPDDGCSADCKSIEVCGDGVVGNGEQCDLGSANSNAPDAACRTDCSLRRCGDMIIDPLHLEQCDDGTANADMPDTCRVNCQSPRCGDAILDVLHGEVCDDGNTTSGDGCSSDCLSKETCGNGYVDLIKGEQCDDGTSNSNLPNAACRTNCTVRRCGDTIVDSMFGELCDLGAMNSNVANATCRTDCLPQRCGDGILDNMKGEVCDDGNVTAGDGCSADCKSLETCGNGIVDTVKGEQCDAGVMNANTSDAPCRTNCQLPKCGDNIVDPSRGEICDLGGLNSNAPNATCRTNCTPQRCGDKIVDTTKGEVCDDGNNVSGDGCSADCKSNETCGNSIVDTIKGEQCDAGANNSNAPNAACRTNCQLPKCGDSVVDTALGELCDLGASNSNLANATCRTNCQPQRCGDKIIDNLKGEVCDDGNNTAGDGCSADCKSNETCGNGIIDTIKGEVCDNGGLNSNSPNATCRTTCQPQKCGDSIVDTAFGELCDLGAANSNLANAACRTNCQPQRCGDGIIDTAKGEVCDDGNNISGDGCSGDCKSNETCGNGIVDTIKGEQCDAGVNNSNAPNAPCRTNCTLPKCGDGIIDTALGEVCDNGGSNSNAPNSACRTTCVPARCGDGIIDNTLLGEVCDDGNTSYGDGCSGDCKSNETCGNGYVDQIKGEQCDDGNTRSRDGCSKCQLENVVVVHPGGAPPARESPLIVYDGARQRVVMFGGYTLAGALGDTWEWDGTSWSQVFTKHSPSPRFDTAAAYDAIRHRVVMFGGYTLNYGGNVNETWEYDGQDWTLVTPKTTRPSARAGGAMAFDANLGHTIMFGGVTSTICENCGTFNSTGSPVAETWLWDGSDWTQLNPASPPAARGGARMVFDSAAGHNYVLMFGGLCAGNGTNCTTPDNHAYTWNGSAWSDLGATAGPTTGWDGSALAFDANVGKVVAWGGTSGTTYEWSGSGWTAVSATTPAARTLPNMTYDAIRKQLVLFGGADTVPIPSNVTADTWVRSGSGAWTQPAAFNEPPARFRAAAVYDPLRRRTVLFGGQGASSALADTWEWDGAKWTNVGPSTPPAARGGSFLDYDTTAKTVRLYGGDDGTSFYTDVQNYSGSAWAAQSSAGRTQTSGSTMSFHGASNTLVTFGGKLVAGGTATNQMWSWGGAWAQNTPGTLPAARFDTATAYDRARQRTVIFSGNPGTGGQLNDIWEWNGSAWSAVGFSGGPGARTGHRLLYNPDSQKVVVFGNANSTVTEDVWEWNGSIWHQPTMVGSVAPKYQPSIAYDAAHHALVAFSGRDATLSPTTGTAIIQYRANGPVETCTSAQIDYDNDGLAGCNDDECWSVCNPLCPPGVTCPGGSPKCGDGTCQPFEDCNICPTDCGACTGTCGDFHCDSGETHTSCPNDC